jgi:hypothetical protein
MVTKKFKEIFETLSTRVVLDIDGNPSTSKV